MRQKSRHGTAPNTSFPHRRADAGCFAHWDFVKMRWEEPRGFARAERGMEGSEGRRDGGSIALFCAKVAREDAISSHKALRAIALSSALEGFPGKAAAAVAAVLGVYKAPKLTFGGSTTPWLDCCGGFDAAVEIPKL